MTEMRVLNLIDLVISSGAVFMGIASMMTAVGIWRVRNGGMLTRALCGKLVAFGLWSLIVLISTIFQWSSATPVSSLSMLLTDVDRMVLIIPQFLIIFFVLPHTKSTK